MSEDKVYFEAEFDSDDGGFTPTAVRLDTTQNLAQNLKGERYYNPYKPLRDVFVLKARDAAVPDIIRSHYSNRTTFYDWDTSRYNQWKPEYVRAFLNNDDLNFSANQIQMSRRNQILAKIIRARGLMTRHGDDYDDCGHIVAKWLGGPFVDYNLFPQSYALNQGHNYLGMGNFGLWKSMEWFMWLWLKLKSKNPKVEWTVRLYYDDDSMPDRPSTMTFSVKFLAGQNDKEDDNDENGRDVLKVVRNLLNTSKVALQSPTVQIEAAATYKSCMELCAADANRHQLLEILKKLAREIKEVKIDPPNPQRPQSSPSSSSSSSCNTENARQVLEAVSMIHPQLGALSSLLGGNSEEAAERMGREQMRNAFTNLAMGAFFGFPGGK